MGTKRPLPTGNRGVVAGARELSEGGPRASPQLVWGYWRGWHYRLTGILYSHAFARTVVTSNAPRLGSTRVGGTMTEIHGVRQKKANCRIDSALNRASVLGHTAGRREESPQMQQSSGTFVASPSDRPLGRVRQSQPTTASSPNWKGRCLEFVRVGHSRRSCHNQPCAGANACPARDSFRLSPSQTHKCDCKDRGTRNQLRISGT